MSLGGYKLRPLVAPEERVPGSMAPGATTGTLAPVPAAMWPGGPTDLSFLYAQLQQAAFLGTAQTWTQPQTLAFTDTGGGVDRSALRPAIWTLQHFTTSQTVAGVGTAIYHQVNDASGNLVRIGKNIVEITTTVAGIVDSTQAWCVMKGGTEIEVFRIKGAQGLPATLDPNGSVAGDAAQVAPGYVGGQLGVRGQLFVSPVSSSNNTVLRNVVLLNAPANGVPAPAAGFGFGTLYQLIDAGSNLFSAAALDCVMNTATSGSPSTELDFYTTNAGTLGLALKLDNNGILTLPGPAPQLVIPKAPVVTPNFGLLNIGDAGFAGGGGTNFNGNINGSGISLNFNSSYTGRFLDCQIAGASKFFISSGGNAVIGGSIQHTGTAVGFFGTAPTGQPANASLAALNGITAGASYSQADMSAVKTALLAIRAAIATSGLVASTA